MTLPHAFFASGLAWGNTFGSFDQGNPQSWFRAPLSRRRKLLRLHLRNGGEIGDPVQLWARPILQLGDKGHALAYGSHTDGVELRLVSFGSGVNRWSASRAESLHPLCPAFCRLYVDGRLTGNDFECFASDTDDGPKRRPGEALAVSAMTNGGLCRVSLGLVGNVTAVASTIDSHS